MTRPEHGGPPNDIISQVLRAQEAADAQAAVYAEQRRDRNAQVGLLRATQESHRITLAETGVAAKVDRQFGNGDPLPDVPHTVRISSGTRFIPRGGGGREIPLTRYSIRLSFPRENGGVVFRNVTVGSAEVDSGRITADAGFDTDDVKVVQRLADDLTAMRDMGLLSDLTPDLTEIRGEREMTKARGPEDVKKLVDALDSGENTLLMEDGDVIVTGDGASGGPVFRVDEHRHDDPEGMPGRSRESGPDHREER